MMDTARPRNPDSPEARRHEVCRDDPGALTMAIDRFVLKMALRKSLSVIKGLRRHVSAADEDIMVLKLHQELDVAGYEIVKKPGNAGFTFESPGGGGSL